MICGETFGRCLYLLALQSTKGVYECFAVDDLPERGIVEGNIIADAFQVGGIGRPETAGEIAFSTRLQVEIIASTAVFGSAPVVAAPVCFVRCFILREAGIAVNAVQAFLTGWCFNFIVAIHLSQQCFGKVRYAVLLCFKSSFMGIEPLAVVVLL